MTNADSVKDRLKMYASKNEKTMLETLIAYGLERTLYRISISPYSELFTLKGGIFLYAYFEGEFARATRDIDLLAKNISNDIGKIKTVFEIVFSIECDDAIVYDISSLEVKSITSFKEYHGVNVSIMAYLDRTKIPVSIDIGFGDVIYPDRVIMDYPVLLDMEIPRIYAYSVYSVISEKFEAIVSLGNANSRYKDFYDIYILAANNILNGSELKEAVQETFDHRKTGFEDIVVFEREFVDSIIHQNRWNAFVKKKKAVINVNLDDVVILIKQLMLPITESISDKSAFSKTWNGQTRTWS